MALQPNIESRWTWGAWLTLAIAVAWIVGLIGLTLLILRYPFDGWTAIRDAQTGTYEVWSRVTNDPSPLQVGDRIIAIDGQPFPPHGPPPFPTNLEAGQTLRYTIERGGETHDVDVTLVKSGVAGMVQHILWRWQQTPRDFIVSLVSFLVVAVAFFLRPSNLGARYLMLIFSFYFAVQWFGFAISGLYAFTWPRFLTFPALFLESSWWWYFFPSLTLMALAFPVVKSPLRRFPRLLPALLYGVPLVLSIFATYQGIVTHDYRWFNLLLPVDLAIMALTVFALFGTLVHNWLSVRELIARAQLRWVTLGLGLGLGLMFAIMLIVVLLGGRFDSKTEFILWLPLLVPISLAIAITRYRLFDIDVIIRRTLIYSVLTACLALIYLGSIVVLQRVVSPLLGGNDQITIVASTLVIAALFQPLRRRIQAVIDRRFFRRKYDAQQTVQAFSAKLRDETDLDQLMEDLVGTVERTLQPAHVSLWINSDVTKGHAVLRREEQA